MSITSINPRFYGMENFLAYGRGASLGLDATGKKLAQGFIVPKTGTIDKVGVVVKYRGGTGGVYDVGIMNPAADGKPSTSSCYGGSALKSWNPASTGLTWITLDTPASATKGDYVYWYIVATSATGTNYIYAHNQDILTSSALGSCYHHWYSTTTFGTPSGYTQTTYAVQYSTGEIFGIPVVGFLNTNTSAAGDVVRSAYPTLAVDEVGAKIILPQTVQATGFSLLSTSNYSGTVRFRVYNSSDTVLSEITLDNTEYLNSQYNRAILLFSSPITFTANQTYRITIYAEENPNTGPAYLFGYVFEDESHKDNLLLNCSYSSTTYRNEGGAWTDVATEAPVCSLWINGIEL